ncbi:MAG: restriction endonuclease [Opitutales bacterium]
MENKKYWLHRISHYANISRPLLENGYLSIGFSDFSENENITIKEGKNIELLSDLFEEQWGKRKDRRRFHLYRFLYGMKKGDIVLVPDYKKFSLYEIIDEEAISITNTKFDYELKDWNNDDITRTTEKYLFWNKHVVDLGFVRKVRPIKLDLEKNSYADSLLSSRMKARDTNLDISDLEESILKAKNAEKPICIYNEIQELVVGKILNVVKSQLTPDKLEVLVKWYFGKLGASFSYIPAKNETGKEGYADLVAIFEPLKTIFYVQVKKYDGETNQWAVEQISSYKGKKEEIEDDYSKIAWVISTADSYSLEAINLAKESNVKLINGLDLAKMLMDIGISDLDL